MISAALAAAWMLAGCVGTSVRPGVPEPVVTESEARAAATLLRLEDRREWNTGLFDSLGVDPSAATRRRTALTLGRLRDARALLPLVRLLADADTSVAATAAFALGQVGDTAAVAPLTAAATPARALHAPTVVGEAAWALGALRTAAGYRAVAALLQGLDPSSASPLAAGPALLALWRSPGAAAEVARWTRASDPDLRWRAAYTLARGPASPLLRALQPLAADYDLLVRSFAVRGLTGPRVDSAGIARSPTLQLLIAALRDGDSRVRVNAARSLGGFPGPAAVQALHAQLGGDADVAIAAVESLGRIGPPAASAAPSLRQLVAGEVAPIQLRGTALLALASVAPREAEAVLPSVAADSAWRLRSSAARTYAALGSPNRAELVALARDPDPRVAAAALGAAVEAAGSSPGLLRPLLTESLGAADVMVRAAALDGFARLADPPSLPALLDAYARARSDPMDDAALAAIRALAALQVKGIPASRSFFVRFPRSPLPVVRTAVAAAFGEAAEAWGPAVPLETEQTAAGYRALAAAASHRGAPPPRLRLATTRGEVVVELFSAAAPLTVDNLLRLAERGYFDGQEWPRMVPNFVLQGGDPRGDTSGGPGYSIRDEINRHRYVRGTVGMALSGPDTGGSQFFITHSPQPHLDGIYTVFGRVVAGMEVVDRLLAGDRIVRAEVVR
jgi:cyclophilin family peptidyl-prolyl cis-trans isomerase/HEAT repeat protein